MKSSMQRRVGVASYWASSRISVLDSLESYEDSYAITQEFREWITSSRDFPEKLEASVLEVPTIPNEVSEGGLGGLDEMLEI